jgi:hypothetical protein
MPRFFLPVCHISRRPDSFEQLAYTLPNISVSKKGSKGSKRDGIDIFSLNG